MTIPSAYIVDAVRSPTGRRRGSLADVHGADLGAHVLRTLVERNAIPDNEYDDVIFGCVDTIGPLAGDIARTACAQSLGRACRPVRRTCPRPGSTPPSWPMRGFAARFLLGLLRENP